MHGRLALALLVVSAPAFADDAQISVRAELAPSGDAVNLVTTSGTKKAGVRVEPAKGKAIELHAGEAAATLDTAHDRTVIALSVIDAKAPFRIHALSADGAGKAMTVARPNKRNDYPYAIAMTPTPTGFTVFFQEIEIDNPNEAHTYMVELDKTGKPGAAKEVAIPWALADAAWNGDGYHLALFYTGDMNGARLSMVSTDKNGGPQQHPDWASAPGAVTDVHLVTTGGKIRAVYRGGAGDQMYETDVTKIGQWGNVTVKAKGLGAISSKESIAISAKGAATKIKR